MHVTAARLLDEVERAAPEGLRILQRLIQIPSTLGQERPAQDYLASILADVGVPAQFTAIDPGALARHPGAGYVLTPYEGRPNLEATLAPEGTGGRSVILNGHVDVVSAEPVHLWSRDPWLGQVEGGRVYGRGAGDMKGGLCQILLALTALRRSGLSLAAPVTVQFVVEEECTGNGTLARVLEGSRADAVIVTEPRGLKVGVATMGVAWFRVTVRGGAGHVQFGASTNAIEKAYLIIEALKGLAAAWNRAQRPEAFASLPRPVTFNVGIIQSGDWPSSVPSECTFSARISFFPGTSLETVRSEIRSAVETAAKADPWLSEFPPAVEFYGLQAEGAEVGPRGHAALELLGECHREVLGEPLHPTAVAACNDTRAYNLYAGTPALTYGPTAANIHGVDEYVEWDSVVAGAKVLALFCMEWAGRVSAPRRHSPAPPG